MRQRWSHIALEIPGEFTECCIGRKATATVKTPLHVPLKVHRSSKSFPLQTLFFFHLCHLSLASSSHPPSQKYRAFSLTCSWLMCQAVEERLDAAAAIAGLMPLCCQPRDPAPAAPPRRVVAPGVTERPGSLGCLEDPLCVLLLTAQTSVQRSTISRLPKTPTYLPAPPLRTASWC